MMLKEKDSNKIQKQNLTKIYYPRKFVLWILAIFSDSRKFYSLALWYIDDIIT